MINFNEPIQLKQDGEWIDCRLGMVTKNFIGIYLKTDKEDDYFHFWVTENELRNAPKKFKRTIYAIMHNDGTLSTVFADPQLGKHPDVQVRKIELEWEG